MAELRLGLGLLSASQELSNVPQERKVQKGRGPCRVQHKGGLSNHEDDFCINATLLNPFTPSIYS